MTQYLLALLMVLRPHHAAPDEPEQRQALMGVVAAASSTAAERACAEGLWSGDARRLGVLIVVTGYMESGYLPRIAAGDCRGFECDAYRTKDGQIRYRARSFFQINASPMVPVDEWRTLTGLDPDAIGRSAWAAARIISEGKRRCRTDVGALSFYAGVASCRWSGAVRRVAMADRLERNAR